MTGIVNKHCRHFGGVLVLCASLLASPALQAAPAVPTDIIVSGPAGAFTHQFATLLQKALGASSRVRVDSADGGEPLPGSASIPDKPSPVPAQHTQDGGTVPGLRVSLGDQAFVRGLAEAAPQPLLGLYISHTAQAQQKLCGRCSVIYSDPDPAVQIRLIRALLPAVKRVGVLYGKDSTWVKPYLQRSDHHGLLLVFQQVGNADDLGRGLGSLLDNVDVLLAVHDSALYNATTARLVLLSAYRQGRPVIGPSDSFVAAGSLATTWFDVNDQVDAAARAVRHFQRHGRLPGPAYPGHFTVKINDHVAQAYDVAPQDIKTLVHRLGGAS